MAKKRITQITVERTAFLTTDYFAIDSATGTNNTARISGPNLLAQLSGGPTTPTFQVKLSTLATAGLGGTSRLARGFDIFGTNPKATTAAVENLLQVASNDAASPLALRFSVKTDATSTSRYGSIEVDDAGTKRSLVLQPTTGFVGVNTVAPNSELSFGAVSAAITMDTVDGADTKRLNISGGGSGSSILRGAYMVLTGNENANPGLLQFRAGSVAGAVCDFSALASGATQLLLNRDGNIGFNTTTFGASLLRGIVVGAGVAPSTFPADVVQIWAQDIVAGQCAIHCATELGKIIRLYQQAHIADPAAGGTVDAEARTAINAILVALENTRLLAAA